MVRPKRGDTSLTAEAIKRAAKRQMAEHGTAGLSLRGIARELGVTAPAIYNYFPRLEDLITALIVGAYNDLALALDGAARQHAGRSPGERLREVLLDYRLWALERRVDFTLIYGSPIPGYHAPVEKTRPPAQRGFAVILALLAEAQAQGLLKLPQEQLTLPEGLAVTLPQNGKEAGPEWQVPMEVLYAGVVGWYHIHGMIMLELFGHTQSLISDTGTFYAHEIENLLQRFGLL